MELLMDPQIWVGLLTLVVLEIVLGIDNLVFIAILADKLPPKQRDKARLIGLSLALIMRLGLLSVISWMVTLLPTRAPRMRLPISRGPAGSAMSASSMNPSPPPSITKPRFNKKSWF